MKITDENAIKNGEKELLDTIIGDLDWYIVEKIFNEKHRLKLQDDVEYRQGDIVIHGNDVAYKLDFDVKVTLSILLDRTGNYVELKTVEAAKEGVPDDKAPVDAVQTAADRAPISDRPSQSDETNPPNHLSAEESGKTTATDSDESPEESISYMTSEIADMITELNEEKD